MSSDASGRDQLRRRHTSGLASKRYVHPGSDRRRPHQYAMMTAPVESPPGRADYLRWNDTLASHFFNPGNAAQRVHLQVDEDLVGELGQSVGGNLSNLLEATLTGPPWVSRAGICQQALEAGDGWRARGRPYPPYLAYLSVFVLAASVEGSFAPHAYYPRLRSLLGMEQGGMLPHFDRMLELWDDLETWSVRDRNGELGIFEAAISGGWIHVGLPLAQAILTTAERRSLPRLFDTADLDPTTIPTNSELIAALRAHGAGILRARTMAVLTSGPGSDTFRALIDAVAEEFASWDGQAPADSSIEPTPATPVLGRLRICLAFDPVARRATVTLRANSNRPFPEEGLRLAGRQGPNARCDVAAPGWSDPLTDPNNETPVRPSAAEWSAGLSLSDASQQWVLRLPAAEVRIFEEGTAAGLPGLIEVPRVPRSQAFYVAFSSQAWAALRSWAEGCPGWRPYGNIDGLPPGWQLGFAERTLEAGPARFAALAFADRLRLRLVGGLRSAAGNAYFPFALPRILIDGGSGKEELWCDGERLRDLEAGRGYRIPAHPPDSRITIEARRDETILTRASLFSAPGFNWHVKEPIARVDRFGELHDDAEPWISGALVTGGPADPGIPSDPLRSPGLRLSSRRIFFIGRHPDEVWCWPSEPPPESWSPVWAISITRRGRAVYCGPSSGDAGPLPLLPGRVSDPRWRQVLWRWRHRVTPPNGLASRWKQYQEAARRDIHR